VSARRPLLAYYYPAHHRPRPGEASSGWYEWDLVRAAQPWFPGHAKPDVPLWGELDDSLPETFARQAAAAHGAGFDGFVFDYWWRPDGATLYVEVLERAILPAYAAGAVPAGFDLGMMWCPVWPRVALPIGMADPPTAEGTDRHFPFDGDDLVRMCERAHAALAHPRAFRVDGRPLLAVFQGWRLAAALGADARPAIAALRRWARGAGLPGLFIAACLNQPADADALADIGLDALTSYVFWPDWGGPARQDYAALAAARRADWESLRARLPIPFWPAVTVGWDATPRGRRDWDGVTRRFPFTPVLEHATPAAVAAAIGSALDFLDEGGAPAGWPVLVASWNEWSESHRLEPCVRWGDAHLRAIAALRGR
jgi:hypothetical protein